MKTQSRNLLLRLLHFISQLFKSLWLFFPGILFLLFTIFCFWLAGQGKDLMVAFTENESSTHLFFINYMRIIFFIAIGFWVYVSWFSSRIIAYIKRSKLERAIQEIGSVDKATADELYTAHAIPTEVNEAFLDEMPRIIGNACFLILELAVLQSPVLTSPISLMAAVIIFLVALVILHFVNRWITTSQAEKPGFKKVFWILIAMLLVFIGFISLSIFTTINIMLLFALLILFHIVFIFYINLRRVEVEKKGRIIKEALNNNAMVPEKKPTWFHRVMDYFCVPLKESGYFKWFLYIGLLGIIFYLCTIIWLSFARGLGPFPFIILAFGVLLAFGNIVTAFSIRFNINFHFLLLIFALLLGLRETHYVRTNKPANGNNNYSQKPLLKDYLTAWVRDRHLAADTSGAGYDMYFIMANGGASRSGYWTANVLGKIEDATLQMDSVNRFSDHVFCLSGTSGGGVGVATFFALLRDKQLHTKPEYKNSAREFLKQDYFTYTFARMLGPDFFNYIFHFSTSGDRAAALETSFEESSRTYPDSVYQVPFYDMLSNFPALTKEGKVNMPLLCVNTTRMQDGNPGVVTNLKLDSFFNKRVDVLCLLGKDSDISITSGSILGARFPYLSPAGRIADNYFVDGGYFDNSGAGMVQEMIRGIVNIASDDSINGGSLYKQIKRLHFKVLHITNSPVDPGTDGLQTVAPINNDLLAPIITITGAYGMQTTVNDERLIKYIDDLDKYTVHKADYTQIPLYKDSTEWKKDDLYTSKRFTQEPPYAMNWFMSDTTVHRIDIRLNNHPKLDSLISNIIKRSRR